MNGKTLHARLKSARLTRGLTLRDVEKLSQGQITNSYVSLLERGIEKSPHPHKLRVLSQVLKLDFLELMVLSGFITIRDLKGRL